MGEIPQEEKEKRTGASSNAWAAMNYLLFEMLESNNADLTREDIALLPDPDEAPEWAAPLISHARGTSANGKDLTIELLDILENIIKERKEKLP